MFKREELKILVSILTRRCKLNCTQDVFITGHNYDEWCDSILEEFSKLNSKDN